MVLFCHDCGVERNFVQPPCIDGHGADCPEYACPDCGAAVITGPGPFEETARANARIVA
jgi:hypothetical protein